MAYKLRLLSDKLLFLTYDQPPSGEEGRRLAKEFEDYFDNTRHPLHLLVDGGAGAIWDIRTQRKMITLTTHPNMGFAAAYLPNSFLSAFVSFFLRLNKRKNSQFFSNLEDALRFLNEKEPTLINDEMRKIIYQELGLPLPE